MSPLEFLNGLNKLIEDTDLDTMYKAKENVHIRKRRAEESSEPEMLWILLENLMSHCIRCKVVLTEE